MNILINSVNINFKEREPKSVHVHFEISDSKGGFQISGNKTLEYQEYNENSDPRSLERLIIDGLSNFIENSNKEQ